MIELQIVLLLVSALRHSLSTDVSRTSREEPADCGDASAPQSPSEEPAAPVFTRLLHAAAASPALCRRWENSELQSLAFQTLSCCAALSAEHASTLMQVQSACDCAQHPTVKLGTLCSRSETFRVESCLNCPVFLVVVARMWLEV